MDRQRVGAIVREAAQLANERHVARGLPPLPHITPHSLRRTHISIALLANNFDVKWVMSQVGHADSKMTMDVYAQLEQRAARSHGAAFDRIVRAAREQLETSSHSAAAGRDWPAIGPRAENQADFADGEPSSNDEEPRDLQGPSEVARPRFELGTPRFSDAPRDPER
jgi:hypothetical protein